MGAAGLGAAAGLTSGALSGSDGRETSTFIDALGVNVNGTYPENYGGVISSRHENAEEDVRRVFDRFAEQVQVRTADYPDDRVAYYDPSPMGRGVYFNAGYDLNNPRGAGSTYYHEIGHMIDHMSGDYYGYASDDPAFLEALLEDGLQVIDLYSRMSSSERENAQRFLYQDKCHSFSDLIDAISKGKIKGAYGHTREYWDDMRNISKEAFAHFFEASMGGGEKLEILYVAFPKATAVFRDIISSLLPKEKVLVLRR